MGLFKVEVETLLSLAQALAYEVDEVDVVDGDDKEVEVDDELPDISNLLISGKNLEPEEDEVFDEEDVEDEVDEVEEGEHAAGGSTLSISLWTLGSINFLLN